MWCSSILSTLDIGVSHSLAHELEPLHCLDPPYLTLLASFSPALTLPYLAQNNSLPRSVVTSLYQVAAKINVKPMMFTIFVPEETIRTYDRATLQTHDRKTAPSCCSKYQPQTSAK
ncbi:hypothetical protein E3N88_19238 [Mikania micrantha]|uniref:Uncharacterized protein n=1 Tax=Mikania micrantha TaxID=192012 RepID=A0A5N6NMM8_9ASTR|nr:hypothetical protein E3N88_19238 [Mikania micrantha]